MLRWSKLRSTRRRSHLQLQNALLQSCCEEIEGGGGGGQCTNGRGSRCNLRFSRLAKLALTAQFVDVKGRIRTKKAQDKPPVNTRFDTSASGTYRRTRQQERPWYEESHLLAPIRFQGSPLRAEGSTSQTHLPTHPPPEHAWGAKGAQNATMNQIPIELKSIHEHRTGVVRAVTLQACAPHVSTAEELLSLGPGKP